MKHRFNPERRKVLKATAAAGGAVASAQLLLEAEARVATTTRRPVDVPMRDVRLRVNGAEHELRIDPRMTLLDTLRERLHLTGAKKGCDQGQYGACTVIVDGRRIVSCLTLAVMQEGHEITTIEGLGTPRGLHPLHAAFVTHDGGSTPFTRTVVKRLTASDPGLRLVAAF